jgi:hypothetical protein
LQTKEAVFRIVDLEGKHATQKAAQIELCYVLEAVNKALSQVLELRAPLRLTDSKTVIGTHLSSTLDHQM